MSALLPMPLMPTTVTFGNFRLATYVLTFALSGTVLGLAAKFANVFLPDIHHDFTIFSLIVPSLTIFVLMLLWQWSQPRIEVPVMFILFAIWLAMGSWSADVIGHIECYPLGGQLTPTKNNGTMSARTYCYEMKVIEAFSWMTFIILAIFFILVIVLANRAQTLGRRFAWLEDVRFLPWFNEYPGYQQYPMGQQGYYYPQQQYPGSGYVVQQNPGHSVVIQHGSNGGGPVITQVPGTVSSV